MLFRSEVEDAALLIMSKAVRPGTGVTGEAPVANSAAQHVGSDPPPFSGAPGAGMARPAGSPRKGKGGGGE